MRCIEGLKYDIASMMQLRSYWSLNDVFKLAVKIERQLKKTTGNRYMFQDGYARGGSKSTLQSKVIKGEDKKKGTSGGKQETNAFTPCGGTCFKCHSLGHVASDCPSRRVITFVKEEEDFKEEGPQITNAVKR